MLGKCLGKCLPVADRHAVDDAAEVEQVRLESHSTLSVSANLIVHAFPVAALQAATPPPATRDSSEPASSIVEVRDHPQNVPIAANGYILESGLTVSGFPPRCVSP